MDEKKVMGQHSKPGKHTTTGQRAGRHLAAASTYEGKHAEEHQLNTAETERMIRERAQLNEDLQRRINEGR